MRRFFLSAAAAVLLAPSSGAAQMLPRPALTTHNWFSLGVGAGPQRAGDPNVASTTIGLIADVGVRMSERFAVDVTGVITADPPFTDRVTSCEVTNAPGNPVVCHYKRTVSIHGVAASFATTIGESHGTPRLLLSAGGGAFGLNGGRYSGGFVGGAQIAPIATEHLAIIASATGLIIPHYEDLRLWLVPITLGVRLY